MLLTEEEAKEKWCPQLEDQRDRCIGCACMAWRWARVKETQSFLTAVAKHMSQQDKPDFRKSTQAVFATGDFEKHTEGYCGLAGPIE